MLKIGLTGGIGSGKSTVCQLFQQFGVEIIDADVIARQLVKPGLPALLMLTKQFGKQILTADGGLNRTKLRSLVFSDSKNKQLLDDIMHPLIYAQIAVEIENLCGKYCIIAIPLLLETQKTHLVDRVLVVDCSPAEQLERVISRDQLSHELILSIIASQMPRSQRLMLADDVIDNSSTQTQLAEQIKKLHNLYILLATARTSSA